MFLNAAVPEILASISLFLIVRTYISHVSKSYFKEKCMGEIGAGLATFIAIELAVTLLFHGFAYQLVSDLLSSIDVGGQLITNIAAKIGGELTNSEWSAGRIIFIVNHLNPTY